MAQDNAQTTEEQPYGELTTRTMAMPADTNASGDIFGGWVVSQMDIAAGIAAGDCAQSRVVTIAIDSMTFIRPVKVGDVMCVYTKILGVGRSSMLVHVEAWALRHRFGIREKVTSAHFTFVAVDDDGKSIPIDEERRAQFPAKK